MSFEEKEILFQINSVEQKLRLYRNMFHQLKLVDDGSIDQRLKEVQDGFNELTSLLSDAITVIQDQLSWNVERVTSAQDLLNDLEIGLRNDYAMFFPAIQPLTGIVHDDLILLYEERIQARYRDFINHRNQYLQTELSIPNEILGDAKRNKEYSFDVFMIMPFEDQFSRIYQKYILPVAKELGLQIKRGDDFFKSRSVMNDIWSSIVSSKIVVAECTNRNANVFYELGLAHALDKKTILITQNIEDIPFDIRHLRIIAYDSESPEELSKQLAKFLQANLEDIADWEL